MSELQPELFDTDMTQGRPINSEENANTFVSIMALDAIRGVGQKTIQTIYDLGIINSIWDFGYAELKNSLADAGKKKLDLPRIIADQKSKLLKEGEQEVENLIKDGINFIANKFEEYPQALNTIRNPPRWLFVMGNASILSNVGIVAIVGTREASQEGRATAYHLTKEFAFQNIVVLSGLADGTDKQAHKGTIDHYGQTIGVLGHGFDAVYASKDKPLWNDIVDREGTIITEYLPSESPSRENFLRRNELQAALSKLVIPVEVPDLASGTGATIRRALSQKTPLLGIDLGQHPSPAIQRTVENLRRLQIPVFNLPNEFEKFWEFVRSILSAHTWDAGPRQRQERFVKVLFGGVSIIYDFADELKKASFTKNDIDWLSAQIKKRLG